MKQFKVGDWVTLNEKAMRNGGLKELWLTKSARIHSVSGDSYVLDWGGKLSTEIYAFENNGHTWSDHWFEKAAPNGIEILKLRHNL